MGFGDFLDGLGDSVEHLASGAEHLAGDSIDGITRGIADGLDGVGLHGLAQAEREYGDGVADMLGATVSELSLDQTTNPKDLVHGDPAAIEKTAGELKKFQAAFEETYRALTGLGQLDWEGKAAEAFRAKYLDHPRKWAEAADACGEAASALSAYASTVTWAQEQAQRAIAEYQQGKKTSQTAVEAYNAQVYRFDMGHGPKPGPFADPGAAQRSAAQQILIGALGQRDAAAKTAEQAFRAATQLAPAEPSFTARMSADLSDGLQAAQIDAVHFYGGIVKGAAGILTTARSLNPEDPYNITHPAAYLDGLSTTAAGLVHAANNPSVLVKSMVGSGWRGDPFQSAGELVPNLALSAATDGAGGAAEAAAEDAAKSAVTGAGEDAAAQAAAEQAATPGQFGHDAEAASTVGDPVDVATGFMTLSAVDAELPGVLPLAFSRCHKSGHRAGRWLGPSWACTADQRLHILDDKLILVRADGVVLSYEHPLPGEQSAPECGTPWLLAQDLLGYTVTDRATGHQYAFSRHSDSLALLSEVSDRSGHRLLFDYDAEGVPTTMRQEGGACVEFTTEQGRIVALRLKPERSGTEGVELVRYGYTDGNLTHVFNSSGQPLVFAYDSSGRIVSWTDRNGSSYRYRYDDRDRCVEQGGVSGHLRYTYGYDTRDPVSGCTVTSVTDSLGNTTRYAVNDLFQVVAVTDPHGHTTRSVWDQHDRLIERTDPLGRTTKFEYDASGSLIGITRPDGARVTAEYNTLGLPVRITEADGSVWCQEYDATGHRTLVVDPTGATTRFSFDDHGNLSSVTDPLGAVTRISTDTVGLPLQVTDPLGATTRFERDAFGRVTRITDPLGAMTEFEWTVEGLLARRVGPDGSTEHWCYDGEGNQVEYTDPVGQRTRCEYTHFDRISARTGPDGTRHEFHYDAELRLVRVVDPKGREWSYNYDAAGHLTEERDFDGRSVVYAYDAAGQLLERTDTDGRTTRYARDVMGRMTAKTTDTTTTYQYDAAGRLVGATGQDGEIRFGYDAAGRLVTESINGHTLRSVYDASGRRVERRTPAGTVSRWSYDPAGRPTTLDSNGRTLTFEYDKAGREIARRIGQHVMLAQSWDVNDRLIAQTLRAHTVPSPADLSPIPVGAGLEPTRPADDRAPGAGHRPLRRAYRYRGDGLLAEVDDNLDGRRVFDLDPSGRVTAVHAEGWSERYAYDQCGDQMEARWLPSREGTDSQGPRSYSGTAIRAAGRTRYEHDQRGRVTLRQKTTLSGRRDTWRYQWDHDDRLVAVTTPDGTQWRYLYDPLGRRIAKHRMRSDGAGVAETIDFIWDGNILAEQVIRDPALRGHAATTWDYAGQRPLTQHERLISPATPQEVIDERFHAIVTDTVGTPTELVDQAGAVSWHARTTVWGAVRWRRGSTAYTPLRFPGQYYDPETQLNYNVQRYYDRETGRYLTPDPLGLRPSPNTRTYVVNPQAATDPLGLSPCDPTGAASAGRPDGQVVLSGHGGIPLGDKAMVTIPDGTNLNMYSTHGTPISDALGNAIETGNPAPLETYRPGQQVPDYYLYPPDGLNIMGNPITVAGPTRLSELLKSGMGDVHWAACRVVMF